MEEKPQVIYKVRKSTGKTVAIIILILLLLASLSYIGIIKYKELSKKNENDEKEMREEMYYSEVENILKQIDMYNQVFKSSYPIQDVNKIDNQLKLQFGILALTKTENIKNYYKIEDIKEMYHHYFVPGFEAIYENIACSAKDDDLYELNHETKTYSLAGVHNHGVSSMDTDTYFISGEIKKNQYIINTHILYSNYCSEACNPDGGYYKNYDDCIKGNDPVMYKKSHYDDIKEELPITTFTFVKDKSYYRLKNVSIT